MVFYRSLFAVIVALALSMSAFAEDPSTTTTTTTTGTSESAAQSTTAQPSTDASQQQMSKVDVNKATAKQLAKIKGLNFARAKAIIAYRKKNGDFKNLDDLKNVQGFKKMNPEQLKDIQDQLTAG